MYLFFDFLFCSVDLFVYLMVILHCISSCSFIMLWNYIVLTLELCSSFCIYFFVLGFLNFHKGFIISLSISTKSLLEFWLKFHWMYWPLWEEVIITLRLLIHEHGVKMLVSPVRGLFCNTMTVSPPGSSVCGIPQARTWEWVSISYSRESSWPKDPTGVSCISCIGRQMVYHCHLGSPLNTSHSSKNE